MRSRTAPSLALAAAVALAIAGCSPSIGGGEADEEPTPVQGEVSAPAEPTAVIAATAGPALAVGASQALFASAPLAVVADGDDPAAQLRGASAAVALGVPLLLDGDDAALTAELERLGTEDVLAVGAVELPGGDGESAAEDGTADGAPAVVPAPADDEALAELLGGSAGEPVAVEEGSEAAAVGALERGEFRALVPVGAAAQPEPTSTDDDDDAELPPSTPAEPVTDVVVMSTGAAADVAAVATARAAGADVLVVPGGDPRASSESVQALAERAPAHVLALGDAFGDADTLGWRAATAATGVELPGGGQLVFPGKRYVALYGTPSTTALGVLGEQDVPATIERAAEHAAPYQALTEDTVVPALEIIATVASAGAGGDGNYSNELAVESLRPLVDAAGEAGQYVVLDLQPGRASFLEQAQLYSELLALPHVGLALDPEWNLGPDETHMVQIGSVTSAEINEVVDWLADFTRENALPQKLLVLHQFQVRMIQHIGEVDLSRTELAVLIHADGQGGQGAKQDTWATLRASAPGVEWWGWKNFYDEDLPMLSPEETMRVQPMPHFVSYQ
ncbi:hypothetical protein [Georgenia faecalis]|uniref:Cell wall-binding repeat-containing protein n=1 Tax=Georgenia faecalis TaxID=2483799 RepID=A0ABV9DA29_9MICO|nr:hypothetical protein [Georgenia faecalis]